jgi:hypothetical protein
MTTDGSLLEAIGMIGSHFVPPVDEPKDVVTFSNVPIGLTVRLLNRSIAAPAGFGVRTALAD